MIKNKWLSVQDYAKLMGKKRQWAYLQIQLGRVKSRKAKKTIEILEIQAVDRIVKEVKIG